MLKIILKIKRWLRCRREGHRFVWRHNYYGDAVYYSGGKRSAWECTRCETWECRDHLHHPPNAD